MSYNNLFWELFKKSGSVDAYLGYKECNESSKSHDDDYDKK